MSSHIDVRWGDETYRCIYIKFHETWDWEDFYKLDEITKPMLDTADSPVCYVVEMSKTRFTPAGISILRIRKVLEFRHPNSDLMVIVGINTYLRMIRNTVLKVLGASTPVVLAQDIDDWACPAQYAACSIARWSRTRYTG